MGNFQESVMRELPGLPLLLEEPMARHTTFKIGGSAQYYAKPRREELAPLLRLAGEENLPLTIIGRGSNLLVGDGGIRGLVVEIGENMSGIRVEGTRIAAEAGALLSPVAQAAAAAGLGGMEFAAGIPGNLGGAVAMNAGACGGEMKDVIEQVTVLTENGDFQTLDADGLELGYRRSCIPAKRYVVTGVRLHLTEKPEAEIREQMAQLRKWRLSRQPLEYPSAGSTFKRPEGYFAGKLIMDAGLAGYAVGGAQVSEKHCGFVVNRGNATAAEVRRLMEDVQERVFEKFGVRLEPEVRFLGDF